MSERRVVAFGLLLLADFVVATVMLFTDKNLQTDFGAQSPYYLHWYGVLAMGVLDLLLALALLAYASVPMLRRMPLAVRSGVVLGALVWSVIAIVATLGIVTSYAQVGFSTMGQFAQYLFGVTAYPHALSYIPGLYDLLLALYFGTAVLGALALRGIRSTPTSSAPA